MKKKLLTIILIVAGIKAFSQSADSTFIMKGHIVNSDKGIVFINYRSHDGRLEIDSSKVINGNFEFTGKMAQPDVAYLKTTNTLAVDSKSVFVFIEPGSKIDIELTDKPFSALKVTGSKTQDEYMEWKNADNLLKNEFAATLNNPPAKNDALRQKNYEDSVVLYNNEKHMVEYNFVKSHPQSYVTSNILNTHYRYYTVTQLKEIYNNMGPVLQASRNGKYLFNNINLIAGISKDALAANIISKDYINNKNFDLSSLKGKYVMIDFWGSWCQPCMSLLPTQVEENRKYSDKNVVFVSVAYDHDANQNKCKEIVNRLGMNWVNLWSSQDKKDINGIETIYDVGIYPTFILIDPSGKIIAREDSSYGYYKCKDLLESALKPNVEVLTTNK